VAEANMPRLLGGWRRTAGPVFHRNRPRIPPKEERNENRRVIIGFTTGHCVSMAARVAGNLGFDTIVAADATATLDRFTPMARRLKHA